MDADTESAEKTIKPLVADWRLGRRAYKLHPSGGLHPAIMPVYYMLMDADLFSRRMRPALAASWQERSFDPCRPLCQELAPAARAFADRFHAGQEKPLLCWVTEGLPFDRHFWQLLVGELLLFAAAEIPEIEVAPETLCALLAPDTYQLGALPRERFPPIQQAHFGTRQLLFGARCYRPEHAGYNDLDDVARLHEYLLHQTPERWTVTGLAELRDISNDEERQQELEFAKEWFPALRDLYQRAATLNQLVISEIL
jgi:hypothetical protein